MGCPKYKECKRGAIVEDFARIGANSTILPGVRIGRNSLVGAGSVVTKDVPANSIVIGNPAKVVKEIDDLKCFPGFFEKPYQWPPYINQPDQ
jgi:acetyltransferase-like isoleucine patch superfamily enzyme